jgi:hypothetical protein
MTAPRVADAVALLLQRPHEAFGEQRVVFDDEDALGHGPCGLGFHEGRRGGGDPIAAAAPACCCRAPEEEGARPDDGSCGPVDGDPVQYSRQNR